MRRAARRVASGEAFAACVPSAHVYRLPRESPGWTYFWLMFNHPYAVARMGQAVAGGGGVTALDADGPAVARLVRLFEGVYQGGFRDRWAQEAALFEFLWEYERHEQGRRYAPPQRERLLEEVRREVMAALDAAPDVARLARAHGMSRSRFSHHFKAVTGLPPARFVAQVRLEEVARLLQETDAPLKELAATGFAHANHLCKVFRRHYHLSPGAFRGQMRCAFLWRRRHALSCGSVRPCLHLGFHRHAASSVSYSWPTADLATRKALFVLVVLVKGKLQRTTEDVLCVRGQAAHHTVRQVRVVWFVQGISTPSAER